MFDFRPYPRWGLAILLVMLTGVGCFRPAGPEDILRAERRSLERTAMVGNLLTTEQMENLVEGQGCFGLAISGEGCCSLVMHYYGYLWSLRIANLAEGLAAFIDGRRYFRCF